MHLLHTAASLLFQVNIEINLSLTYRINYVKTTSFIRIEAPPVLMEIFDCVPQEKNSEYLSFINI